MVKPLRFGRSPIVVGKRYWLRDFDAQASHRSPSHSLVEVVGNVVDNDNCYVQVNFVYKVDFVNNSDPPHATPCDCQCFACDLAPAE